MKFLESHWLRVQNSKSGRQPAALIITVIFEISVQYSTYGNETAHVINKFECNNTTTTATEINSTFFYRCSITVKLSQQRLDENKHLLSGEGTAWQAFINMKTNFLAYTAPNRIAFEIPCGRILHLSKISVQRRREQNNAVSVYVHAVWARILCERRVLNVSANQRQHLEGSFFWKRIN